jgi:cell wall-associated NlpC family hydrolase
VPYVWGGATPGVGFDCSGLTMWAWGQAGVQLPHGATAQYYQIQHVSMSDLQPGDLVFYGSAGYLSHVVMYIGGGMVVQAEQTGTNVMDTPLWPGAYGAGRP